MPDYKHHVFLSYSRKDSSLMQQVRDDLLTEGLSVWTDEGIEPGTPLWKDAIESAIEQTGCLVVILSPEAKKSLWVKRELEYAEAQEKLCFPLLASGNKNNAIPFSLIGAQFIDISLDRLIGTRKLINAIHNHLGIEKHSNSEDAEQIIYTVYEVMELNNHLLANARKQLFISHVDILGILDNFAKIKDGRRKSVSQIVKVFQTQKQITYDDILEALPEAERDIALLDDLMDQLSQKGIEVVPSIMLDEEDELYNNAIVVITMYNKASISLLQKILRIGYTSASQLMEKLERNGLVGPPEKGGKSRKVLI